MLQGLSKGFFAFLPSPIEMAESIALSHETVRSFKAKAAKGIQVEPHVKKRDIQLSTKAKKQMMKQGETTINHQSLTFKKKSYISFF